jgi:hypothetical protein
MSPSVLRPADTPYGALVLGPAYRVYRVGRVPARDGLGDSGNRPPRRFWRVGTVRVRPSARSSLAVSLGNTPEHHPTHLSGSQRDRLSHGVQRDNALGTGLGDRYRAPQATRGGSRNSLNGAARPHRSRQNKTGSATPRTPRRPLVRRGSTVRVRQRARVFACLAGVFRCLCWRRARASVSTRRPLASTVDVVPH